MESTVTRLYQIRLFTTKKDLKIKNEDIKIIKIDETKDIIDHIFYYTGDYSNIYIVEIDNKYYYRCKNRIINKKIKCKDLKFVDDTFDPNDNSIVELVYQRTNNKTKNVVKIKINKIEDYNKYEYNYIFKNAYFIKENDYYIMYNSENKDEFVKIKKPIIIRSQKQFYYEMEKIKNDCGEK